MGLDASNARFGGTVLFPIITFGASGKFCEEGWVLEVGASEALRAVALGFSGGPDRQDRNGRDVRVLFSLETLVFGVWAARRCCGRTNY